jgi:hypothetical protein
MIRCLRLPLQLRLHGQHLLLLPQTDALQHRHVMQLPSSFTVVAAWGAS